jgi:putative MATE family efflux protein
LKVFGIAATNIIFMEIVGTQNLRRSVLQIAWPVVLRTSLNMFVQLVDMAMVGTLGAVPLAAVGLGNQIFFFSVAVVEAFSIGTTALVAQAVGKGDLKTAQKVAAQSVAAVLMTTLALSVILIVFSRQLISGLVFFMPEKDLAVISLGSRYLSLVGISASLRFSMLAVNAVFQGGGNTRTPLLLMILANVINLVGNYLLIFGIGPFPAMGVEGAAMATALAGMIAGGLSLALLFTGVSPVRLDLKRPGLFKFQKGIIGKVISVGVPSAIEQITIHTSQIVYSMITASLGTMAVAAHQIMHSAYTATYLPGKGFSLAATTLVGQFLGARKQKQALRSGLITARFATVLMSLAGLFFFFFPRAVAGLFTGDPAVLALTVSPLRLLALAQPALAYIVALNGGLRGAGDTRWPMGLTILNMLGLRLVLTLAAVRLGYGLAGVWAAMLIESYLRASLIAYRFNSRIPQAEPLLKKSSG